MLILSNLKVHTEKETLSNASVIISDKKIIAIEKSSIPKKYSSAEKIEFPETFHLLPGFIDMHTHGANGCDVMDGNVESFSQIATTLAKEGTTRFLGTTMTAPRNEIEKVLRSARDFLKNPNHEMGAKMLGIHLEGPFLSPKKVGAQNADFILEPNSTYIKEWQSLSNNIIKLVTLSPELPRSLAFIRYLVEHNIIAAFGHTDATYEESIAAISAGCTHATHLFNAMRAIHHREPGVITSALLSPSVYTELILDHHHLHPAIVNLALRLKGADKIILVTDAMRAKCLSDGTYDLGGQSVLVKDNSARLANGILAGSVLKMNFALKNFLQATESSLLDVIKMTAGNPAKALGIFSTLGSIAINKLADLVVLDHELNVVMTLCEGKKIYVS